MPEREWSADPPPFAEHDVTATKQYMYRCPDCGMLTRYEHGDVFRVIRHCDLRDAELVPR